MFSSKVRLTDKETPPETVPAEQVGRIITMLSHRPYWLVVSRTANIRPFIVEAGPSAAQQVFAREIRRVSEQSVIA